jgi:general secretion pathway protein D
LTKAQQEKFARSGPEDITNENFPETIESFDFPNADVADIVKAVSELTGRNFILDPGVRGKVTIIAPSKITVAEAYKMFLRVGREFYYFWKDDLNARNQMQVAHA